MSRLIAFGCSYTYGEGLPDCWVNDERGSNPSKFAWPQILSNKLNIECVNLAEAGCSNKYITDRVLEIEFQKDDIVVFLWTHYGRFCFFQDDGSTKRLLLSSTRNKKTNIKIKRYTIQYYRDYYTQKDSLKDTCIRINFIKNYLDSKKIKNYHSVFDNYDLNETKMLHWNNVKFLDIEFQSIDLAVDQIHPGIRSQALFADDIYKELNNESF